MLTYFWIGLGSALGGMGRYWCSGVIARTFGEIFPWGTIIVNASGSLIIGFVATLMSPDGRLLVPPDAPTFLTRRQKPLLYCACSSVNENGMATNRSTRPSS